MSPKKVSGDHQEPTKTTKVKEESKVAAQEKSTGPKLPRGVISFLNFIWPYSLTFFFGETSFQKWQDKRNLAKTTAGLLSGAATSQEKEINTSEKSIIEMRAKEIETLSEKKFLQMTTEKIIQFKTNFELLEQQDQKKVSHLILTLSPAKLDKFFKNFEAYKFRTAKTLVDELKQNYVNYYNIKTDPLLDESTFIFELITLKADYLDSYKSELDKLKLLIDKSPEKIKEEILDIENYFKNQNRIFDLQFVKRVLHFIELKKKEPKKPPT